MRLLDGLPAVFRDRAGLQALHAGLGGELLQEQVDQFAGGLVLDLPVEDLDPLGPELGRAVFPLGQFVAEEGPRALDGREQFRARVGPAELHHRIRRGREHRVHLFLPRGLHQEHPVFPRQRLSQGG